MHSHRNVYKCVYAYTSIIFNCNHLKQDVYCHPQHRVHYHLQQQQHFSHGVNPIMFNQIIRSVLNMFHSLQCCQYRLLLHILLQYNVVTFQPSICE